jgi:hypothetical protein
VTGSAPPPPAALADRLDRVLAAAVALVARIPDARLDWTPPGSDRALRDLGFHVLRLGLAYADGMDMGRLPESWLLERAPADLRDGAAIGRYGALVRGRLCGWFDGAGPGEYQREIAVFDGPATGHALLQRITARAAEHLARLHASLAALGVAPLDPLPDSPAPS